MMKGRDLHPGNWVHSLPKTSFESKIRRRMHFPPSPQIQSLPSGFTKKFPLFIISIDHVNNNSRGRWAIVMLTGGTTLYRFPVYHDAEYNPDIVIDISK